MRAVQYDGYGSPDVLHVRDVPVPAPAADEVLVRVYASGVNPKDAIVRSGAMRLMTGHRFPRGTGDDFAGEVAATGTNAGGLKPGQRVWGFLPGYLGGAAAEYLTAPSTAVALMPERLGWVEAAALPLVGSAALQALRDLGKLAAGERLLIKGASGGVGSAAIQIGKALGAHVTAVAGGGSLDHCRALGADAVLDYRQTDVPSIAERFDVFLDCAGRSPYRRYRGLLRRGGRWVAVAAQPSVFMLSPFTRVLAPITNGAVLRYLVVRPAQSDLIALARMCDGGVLRMPVRATWPLDRIGAAHAAVAIGHGRGKDVVVIREAAPTPG